MGCTSRRLWVAEAAHTAILSASAARPAQGLEELITCQATLWASRGKHIFIVSEHRFIYFPGNRERSWEPPLPAAWDTAERAPRAECEEVKGQGHLSSPSPSLSPQANGAAQAGNIASVFTHSCHEYLCAKHL